MMENVIKAKSNAFALSVVKTYKKISPANRMAAGTQFFKSGTSIGANYREAEFAQSRADLNINCPLLGKSVASVSIGLTSYTLSI